MDFSFIADTELKAKAEADYKEALEAAAAKRVEEATVGLKNKNSELLDEKKKIQETLKKFEGIDPEKAAEALRFLEGNEEARMIKEGKINELIEKKTSILKSDFDATLSEIQKKAALFETESKTYKQRYESKIIDDNLREIALAAKVRPEALSDIIMRGKGVFSLGQDGSVEARDSDGKLIKNPEGLVLSPKVWIEGLKSVAPHYWPASESAGFRGGSGGSGDDDVILGEAAKAGNMAQYRKNRQKK